MNTNREQMMNDVCKRLGLEHEYTIMFCKMCEDTSINNSVILNAYIVGMSIDRYTEE